MEDDEFFCPDCCEEHRIDLVPCPVRANTAPAVVPEFDEATWLKKVEEAAASDSDVKWLLGDLAVEGYDGGVSPYRNLGPDGKYEESVYDWMQAITGLSRSTLKDYASTARRFPASVRDRRLSWSHHRQLVNLKPDATDDEKKYFLNQGVEEKLTVKQFTERLKKSSSTSKLVKEEIAFVVKLPDAEYRLLEHLGSWDKKTPPTVAAEIIKKHLADPNVKANAEFARKQAAERTYQKRKKHGEMIARVYDPLKLGCFDHLRPGGRPD